MNKLQVKLIKHEETKTMIFRAKEKQLDRSISKRRVFNFLVISLKLHKRQLSFDLGFSVRLPIDVKLQAGIL